VQAALALALHLEACRRKEGTPELAGTLATTVSLRSRVGEGLRSRGGGGEGLRSRDGPTYLVGDTGAVLISDEGHGSWVARECRVACSSKKGRGTEGARAGEGRQQPCTRSREPVWGWVSERQSEDERERCGSG
jgi:hypothetical protein